MAIQYRPRRPLDVARLQAATHALVNRHDILRMSIGATGEMIIAEHLGGSAVVHFIDLRALGDRGEEEASARSRGEAARAFDLAIAPLLRVHLFQIDARRQLLLIVQHHLVTDRWSREIFERELAELYLSTERPGERKLTPRRQTYADFARWQRSIFPQTPEYRRQLRFWRETLSGIDRVAAKWQDHFGLTTSAECEVRTHRIRSPLRDAVAAECKRQRVTPFTYLLTGFFQLLRSCSALGEFVVTTDVANRHRAEWRRVCGLFTNVLAIRSAVPSDSEFPELLGRVDKQVRSALARHDVPFSCIVEDLFPGALSNYQRWFPIAFFFDDVRHEETLHPLYESKEELDTAQSSRDLMLSVYDSGHSLELTVIVRRSLAPRLDPEGMLSLYESILSCATSGASPRQ